ncbi:MAG: LysM peptidoglycan-binding domain-containing protein [Chlamydiia bacterium]|nr:LysM peptidoglycan-binding domain-containing protein [Chlamydiia bacterium]
MIPRALCAVFVLLPLLFFSSCSPLRSSPSDGQHVFELTLHELQTNLDDVRHDIHCFQTELQILEGRIKTQENALASLREHDFSKQQAKLDQLAQQIQLYEKSWNGFEKGQTGTEQQLKQLSAHAHETTVSLKQFKERIAELEHEMLEQHRHFEELSKVKGNLESLAKTLTDSTKLYRVKQGDTLKKIAADHGTTVEKIKKLNDLQQDIIVIGQQLKIPNG